MLRRLTPIFFSLLFAAAVFAWMWMDRSDLHQWVPTVGLPSPPADTSNATLERLAELSPKPEWTRLDAYQGTITRERFLRLLTEVFTVSQAWRQVIEMNEDSVDIRMEHPQMWYRLSFAPTPAAPSTPPRYWKPAEELGAAPTGRPLAGVHVAIDPGHIGGDFAKLEERWFRIGEGMPVTEGDMTLRVAHLLRPRLEALGAKISLVRETSEPVTAALPQTFLSIAGAQTGEASDGEAVRLLAEKLFYRTSEIRARAAKVNETLRPDLVLCLHFNAEGWGPDPDNPVLSQNNHFHTLVNGAYTDDEVMLPDQRFEMVLKILQGCHDEEVALAKPMAEAFASSTGLPPYLYQAASSRARNIDGNPYIWARNLLANRLYECPVVFLEPYVMNSEEVHARVQAGDYDGVREIHGRELPSIYREYADAVTEGLRQYYEDARPAVDPGEPGNPDETE